MLQSRTRLRLTACTLLFFHISSTAAQTYNPLSTAPSCAQQCPALTAAAALCQSAGSPAEIATCFCTQQTDAGFANDPSVCPTCASASDPNAGTQWFAALCSNPSTVTGGSSTSTSSVASTSSTGPAATTTSSSVVSGGTTPTPVNSGSSTASASVQPISGDGAAETGGWWQNHVRWVIMLIVLAVAFTIIIIVGVLWKRRYNRKHNTADRLPPGSAWGPIQQEQYGNSYGGPRSAEKSRATNAGPYPSNGAWPLSDIPESKEEKGRSRLRRFLN